MKVENIGLITVLFLMAILFSPRGYEFIPLFVGGFLVTGFIWLWKN